MSGLVGSLLGEASTLAGQPAPVTLGPLTLSGPEAPSRIVIGGTQLAAIHKLPGGARVIDAMGPDDAAITWSGVFLGPMAANRVRMLDSIRMGGEPCALAFGDYSFQVVVVQFQYSYESRGAVISYRIRAERIGTATQSSTLSPVESAVADCATAAQFLTNAQASIAAYGTEIGAATIATLTGVSTSLGTFTSTLSTASSETVALAQSSSAASASLLVAQTALPLLSTGNLSGQTTSFSVASGLDLVSVLQAAGALAAVVGAGGYINRATATLASADAETVQVGIHS